jgi:integrase
LKKEEIWEALNMCDVLERAIVLTGVSSGLSAEEIIELKVKNFKEGYDPKTEITTLKLRRQKTNVDFITFLTPEASRAIFDYLEFRNKKLKNKNKRREIQLSKQYVTSDDDYLFIMQRIPPEYLETKNDELRKFNTHAMLNLYRNISVKAQKNTPEGCWNIIRSHNMRKFFNSTLKNSGADHDFVEYCMGHRLSDTKSAYYEGDPEKLREIYARYIPYLTIQKDLDISETPDFKRMAEELENLKAENERFKVERVEFQKMAAELEEVRLEQKDIRKHFTLRDIAREIVNVKREEHS